MATRQEMHHCKNCRKHTMIVFNPPNHILHLILSIITVGGWVIPWLLISIFRAKPRCTECGSAVVVF